MPYKDPAAKKAYSKKHYQENKEYYKEKSRRHARENPEKYAAYVREYRRKHGRKDQPSYSDQEMLHRHKGLQRWLKSPRLSPSVADLYLNQQIRVIIEWWQEEYRVMYNREKSKRRKAKLKGNMTEKISIKDIKRRFAEFANSCAYCGDNSDSRALQIEHVIPISRGGTHVLSNIVPACKRCNYSKHAHDVELWYRSQEFFCPKRWKKILDILGKTEKNINQLSFL